MSEVLMDPGELAGNVRGMADGLAAMVEDSAEAAIIGIRTRGAVLAERIHRLLSERGLETELGILDISLYRDDLSQLAAHPLVRKTDLSFDVTDKLILLVDDVIYTGRTIRSAIDAILDFGRPRAIRLGVLVDRGGREYPIQPDYVALRLDVPDSQVIKVCLQETDGEEKTVLVERATLRPASE